jgi:all-trans-retinol dehydrogenase (NAD+)
MPSFYTNIYKGFIQNFGPLGWFKRKDVTGKIVLITGAANGIGRLMALRFAALRVKLILWDVDENGLNQTAKECEKLGAESVFVQKVDLSSREDIYQAADLVKSKVGHVEILVNNAGIAKGGLFMEKDDQWIEASMKINAIAHLWMAKAFLGHMIETDNGHIVCIASVAGLYGAKTLVDYSASKFAAVGFQEAIENEVYYLNKRHVQFTTVCPFYIQTRMLDGIPIPENLSKDVLSPDRVVDQIMDAILTNQRMVIIPGKVRLLLSLKGLIPRRSFQQFSLSQHK